MLPLIPLLLFIIISSSWALLAIWVQKPINTIASYGLIGCWLIFLVVLFASFHQPTIFNPKTGFLIYLLIFFIALLWFFNLQPSNDRDWDKEVAHSVDFKKENDLITVYNVRNFHWHGENDYDEKWETRQYYLSKLDSADIVLSTWGIDAIAHTLITFCFTDGQQLAFSIETRKEQHETFSSISGFFRQYELAIIASDELDIIYTRTNVRKNETTHIYPLTLPKTLAQKLFLSYLTKGKQLQTHPEWYNSLTANCTTIIYDMIKKIEPKTPFDYRIIASGLLPEYLYDHQILDNNHTLDDWKQIAHIQPKTKGFNTQTDKSGQTFSEIIRKDFPTKNTAKPAVFSKKTRDKN